MSTEDKRSERDSMGEMEVPVQAYYGRHASARVVPWRKLRLAKLRQELVKGRPYASRIA